MNKAILIGRPTRDVDVRATADGKSIARFTLAVDRAFKREGEPDADFINCVAFGRTAEFAEKYARKGVKFAIVGRIQTGSYTNREGVKVYTTDIIVESMEFCESKKDQGEAKPAESKAKPAESEAGGGFMNIPDDIDDDLPFH